MNLLFHWTYILKDTHKQFSAADFVKSWVGNCRMQFWVICWVVPYIFEGKILLLISKIKGTTSSAKMVYIAVIYRQGFLMCQELLSQWLTVTSQKSRILILKDSFKVCFKSLAVVALKYYGRDSFLTLHCSKQHTYYNKTQK